jgi:hypothetical protein
MILPRVTPTASTRRGTTDAAHQPILRKSAHSIQSGYDLGLIFDNSNVTSHAVMQQFPHNPDPGDTSLPSDDEGIVNDNKIAERSQQSAEAQADRVYDTMVTKTTSSTSNHVEQGNLLGILEVSKYFCHSNQDDHDSEIECGVASGLATLLYRSLFLYEKKRETKNLHDQFTTSGLEYIVSLSTSLAMVLHCSTSVLECHISEFESDLVEVLQKLGRIFSSACDEDAILIQVVLTNVCRIIGLIHRYVAHPADSFVETLLLIVCNKSTPNNVKVDATDTICRVLEVCPLETNPNFVRLLEANSSTLISVLSTASTPLSDKEPDPTLRLYDLAAISELIRIKMIKRRCTMLVVVRHFRHASSTVRSKAYSFCHEMIDHPDVSSSYSSNMFLESKLLETLAECAVVEGDQEIQLVAVSLLRKITTMQPFPTTAVMEQIRVLAYSGQSDDIVTECGAAYCEGLQKEPFPTKEQISTVLDFVTFPFAHIRSRAFETLETLLTNSESIEILLGETEMLENFGTIVSNVNESTNECEAALNLARLLSRSSRNHGRICEKTSFLRSLIEFVVSGEIINRTAHFYGVEIILALLSNDETTQAFLPFRQLLPWLVSFLNKTTADDVFKEQVGAVIIRLTTAYLEQKY